MNTEKVTIEEFKDKFIDAGVSNGLPESIINKLNEVYTNKHNKYMRSLGYKANEIIEAFITDSYIDIKVALINTVIENSCCDEDKTDPWIEPMIVVSNIYRVA